MNKVILMGRLTRDPDVKVSQGANPTSVARYTLAVNKNFTKRDDPNAPTADFIGCVAFGKTADFVERYLKKGTKVCISGHIQTGSYVNKDGQKVYTTDVVVEEHEFAESKNAQGGGNTSGYQGDPSFDNGGAPGVMSGSGADSGATGGDDPFMTITEGSVELPFS